ncbi:serine hydrolase domain-containing protein [Sphingobacterium lactis]|uniref:D-alanyl-D-alanine carboxypeptidase n=1 Tax=Sphingobacterium lactis TaxID=797291 RepID=A0A1H5XQB8_9SPHI|nr:serine hydrolase domain-containing protein [Sphingobacterium lactis]SEG13872.1 D-alanyl-D-alanine carboxypeptidase [Sphingobacterium lactis]
MKSLLILALSYILGCSTVFSQKIELQKIDSFVNYIEQNNRGIGSISIFNDGREIYNRSFGQSKLLDIQYNADTKYQIGSITKLVTATLIFKLIEDGKLRLDDPISKFYPNIPNSNDIKIKNLMNHSSGLGDFLEKKDNTSWLTEKVSQDEIFDEIVSQGVLFQPNEKTEYSNTGYFLLARIVEKLYDDDYATIVAEKIANPLNLKNFASLTPSTSNIFPSYEYTDKWEKVKDLEFSNVIGIGDIVSTAKDLNTFLYNLSHYKILQKESIEKMKPNLERDEEFGMGLMAIPFYEHVSFGHVGDTYGTHSIVSYNENDHLGFSFAYNGERVPHNDILIGILSIIYGKNYKYPDFNTIITESEELDKFVGTYSSPDLPLKFIIRKEGNELFGQATGQSSFPLECYDENKFKNDQAELKLIFKPMENKMILNQDGEKIEMKRE